MADATYTAYSCYLAFLCQDEMLPARSRRNVEFCDIHHKLFYSLTLHGWACFEERGPRMGEGGNGMLVTGRLATGTVRPTTSL